MAVYRGVVRHVGYWRGVIHRWSTVYNFVGAPTRALTVTDAENLRVMDSKMCYAGGATYGGAYECQIYDQATGGTAIVTDTHFDWTTPSAWAGYLGTGWTTTSYLPDVNMENSLQVEWAGGSSSSGKPVFMRKWYHATPYIEALGGAAQVSSADIASLQTQALAINGVWAAAGLVHGSSSGRLAGVPTVRPYFGNHQMPKGRKRKALVTASGRYTGPTVTIPDTIPD